MSSRDSVLEHVRLRNASGVLVSGDANATVAGLACDRCTGPPVAVGCKAKVDWTAVTADGVPAMAAQRPCE